MEMTQESQQALEAFSSTRRPTSPSAWRLSEAGALAHEQQGDAWRHSRNSQISRLIERCCLRGRMIYPINTLQPRMPLIQTRAGFKCCPENATTSAALPARLRRRFSAKIKLSDRTRAARYQTSSAARYTRNPSARYLHLSRQELSSRPQCSARRCTAPDRPRTPSRRGCGTPGGKEAVSV